MRIELLGPSGVGKTTVLGIAQAKRTSTDDWMGPKEIDEYLKQVARLRDTGMVWAHLNSPELRELLDGTMAIVASSGMLPVHKLNALHILRGSCLDLAQLRQVSQHRLLVHDELLLNRAFSVLPQARDTEKDATWYFQHVPVPDAAVILAGDPSEIISRTHARGTLRNCYMGLDESALRATVERLLRVCAVAEQTLRSRGVEVAVVDIGGTLEESATALQDFITRFVDEHSLGGYASDLKARLLQVSGSFQTKEGRHELRTRNVYYCGFSIPGFEVERDQSQRSAKARVARFGLTARAIRGASILDLGANAGAMLFQLSNFGPASGLGIEADEDKVQLAQEIAEYAGLPHLRFCESDIDKLESEVLGVFDVVLALAVEKHVVDPDRLYWLLGRVTRGVLCFEGNSGCDVEYVRSRLLAEGFDGVEYLGLCDDDILPENNQRPLLIAYKRDDTPENREATSRVRETVSQACSRSQLEQIHRLRGQTEALRTSLPYRLGNMMLDAVVSPGRNTLLLPYRLLRLGVEAIKKQRSR